MHSASDATTCTSPPPFTSTTWSSANSEVTSDEPGDLGSFTTVFRALSLLQSSQLPSSGHTSRAAVHSETESDIEYARSNTTVWSELPIASYLASRAPHAHAQSEDDESDDTEGEQDSPELLPSLGLDAALGFLAEERARLAASQLDSGASRSVSLSDPDASRPPIEPRRRRRRRRGGASRRGDDDMPGDDVEEDHDGRTHTIVPTPEAVSSGENSPIEEQANGNGWRTAVGIPPAPVSPRKHRNVPRTTSESQSPRTSKVVVPLNGNGLVIPRPLPTPPSPPLQRLRTLATKLRALYPSDDTSLHHALRNTTEPSEPGGFIDTRGPEPTSSDPIVHVFIDYSNILIGFLSYIKRHPELYPRKDYRDKPRLWHEALTLILERGRPVARRELAASKPLYQSLDSVYKLAFDVHLFLRVPHDGGGGNANGNGNGVNSTDSDHEHRHSAHIPQRAKYREQGVDECLQLKLYQSVVEHDPPPPGATIVLATGDGASGQFNADGFPGSVKTALKKGWNVELYAWENALSSAWSRDFGAEQGRFSVRGLEMFAQDLVVMDAAA